MGSLSVLETAASDFYNFHGRQSIIKMPPLSRNMNDRKFRGRGHQLN